MASDDGQQPPERKSGESSEPGGSSPPGQPDYKVYKSRPGALSRLRSADLSGLRDRARRSIPGRGEKDSGAEPAFETHGGGRRKWLLLIPGLAVVWILISLVAFLVSAQLQSSKLADSASSALGGNPFPLVSSQTILVMGTDARDPESLEPGAPTKQCFEQQSQGEAPKGSCSQGEFRADTLLLVRAGGAKFNKLSIPRDTFAEIPGQGSQKINGAFAFGGAGLQIRTIEQFLGIEIDHVVIVDFTGFEDFIDALGGVEINLERKLCADISGGSGGGQGGITLRLGKGENTLDGQEALAYSRIRKLSPCPGPGKSEIAFGSYDDLDRAAAQQQVLNGIKSRLTSPLRLPYNFVKGPIIGWEAPRAFVSDMGGFSMIQMALSSAVAGSGDTDVLCSGANAGCGAGPDGSIEVPESERQRAVKELLG